MSEADNKAKALEDSLYNLLLPVAEQCNAHIDEVAASQVALSAQIDKLFAELERLKALTQCPTAFSPYSKKLIACRDRVENASRTLTSVATRVTRMTVGLRKRQPQAFETQLQKEDGSTEPAPSSTQTEQQQEGKEEKSVEEKPQEGAVEKKESQEASEEKAN